MAQMQDVEAVIFDLDGVISDTAALHAVAWKTAFDLFLKLHSNDGSESFHIERDYFEYVDGKSRLDGISSFLSSRKVELETGAPDDISFTTKSGLGNIKNEVYKNILSMSHDIFFNDTINLIQKLSKLGVRLAVASSSNNCVLIVDKSPVKNKFELILGGQDIGKYSLRSKPYPDIFLRAINQLGLDKTRTIIIEDAPAGVAAASKADVALVVGLDRTHARGLEDHGADLVVDGLAKLEQALYRRGFRWIT